MSTNFLTTLLRTATIDRSMLISIKNLTQDCRRILDLVPGSPRTGLFFVPASSRELIVSFPSIPSRSHPPSARKGLRGDAGKCGQTADNPREVLVDEAAATSLKRIGRGVAENSLGDDDAILLSGVVLLWDDQSRVAGGRHRTWDYFLVRATPWMEYSLLVAGCWLLNLCQRR